MPENELDVTDVRIIFRIAIGRILVLLRMLGIVTCCYVDFVLISKHISKIL